MLKSSRHKALPLIIILSFLVNACNLINPTITKAKYDRLQTGMTRSQVQDIMGRPGEISADISFKLPPIPNLPSGGQQGIYQWKNPDGSLMTAVFINDQLVLKSQVNLK